jgi:hypothetical protein
MQAAKKQPEPSLEERFLESLAQTRELAEQIVDRRVDELKNSNDGADLPREVLHLGLTKFRQCRCQVASEIVDGWRR